MLENCAGPPHIFQSAVAVVRMNIDGSGTCDDDMHFEALANRIQRCFADTVILRQSTNPDTLDTGAAKASGKVCSAEGGITILVRLLSLADDLCLRGQLQVRMESGTRGLLHTVWRPRTASFFKADVMRRMPIACGIHRNAAFPRLADPVIQDSNNLVATVDRKRSPGQKSFCTSTINSASPFSIVQVYQRESWLLHNRPVINHLIDGTVGKPSFFQSRIPQNSTVLYPAFISASAARDARPPPPQ